MKSCKYGNVTQLINAAKGSGASPIVLAIDDLSSIDDPSVDADKELKNLKKTKK